MYSSRAHGSPLNRGPGSGTRPLETKAQGWTRPTVNNLFLLNQDRHPSPLPIELIAARVPPRSCVLSRLLGVTQQRRSNAWSRDAAATNEE
ncbi:hypothetical protein CEP54_002346 [Fusarium duplospermum]|uniref:Uncharacterized protein n=1 Tax=Fusarium duplospermum TaxID=1325734 RepID=A0A428QVM1_9HYPO|nr:hypothetical protein CEP54_002346 [Fusarium duplospermum]